MTERSDLVPGRFYWVKPSFDHDIWFAGIHPYSDEAHEMRAAHWSNQEQPARFNGLSKDGAEQWQFIGVADEDPKLLDGNDCWWSVVWVGDEIKKSS